LFSVVLVTIVVDTDLTDPDSETEEGTNSASGEDVCVVRVWGGSDVVGDAVVVVSPGTDSDTDIDVKDKGVGETGNKSSEPSDAGEATLYR
jgi:hypothetical protein